MSSKFQQFSFIFVIILVNLNITFGLKCDFEEKNDNDVKSVDCYGSDDPNFSFCQKFQNLETVHITEVETVDENLFQSCANLIKIEIQNTKIQEIPQNLFSRNSKLTWVGLFGNSIKTLPANVFIYQEDVMNLVLSDNQINFLPGNIFYSAKKLETLSLNNNKITNLDPAWFSTLEKLEYLSLSNNEISDLPKNVFYYLKNLKSLDLRSNKLTIIHYDSFGTNANLKKIDLQNNKITAIDKEFISNLAISKLNMDGNVCSNAKISNRNGIEEKLQDCIKNYIPRPSTIVFIPTVWTTTREPTTTFKPQTTRTTTTWQTTKKIYSKISSSVANSCGRAMIGLPTIVRGTYIDRGSFPWNAALFRRGGDFFCGGTLVSNKSVVTAAHCIEEKYSTGPPTLAKDVLVYLGAHDLKEAQEIGRNIMPVKSISVHPDWNPNIPSFDADIAILELGYEVPFTQFIQPICLIDPLSAASTVTKAFIVGFGKSENARSENIAKIIEAPIYSYRDCSKSEDHVSLISSRTICGGYANGSGACSGDSGSGLLVNYEGTYYLRGIVSASLFEANECNVNALSVFTDVSKFYGWITNDYQLDGGSVYQLLLDRIKSLEEKIKKEKS